MADAFKKAADLAAKMSHGELIDAVKQIDCKVGNQVVAEARGKSLETPIEERAHDQAISAEFRKRGLERVTTRLNINTSCGPLA